MKKEIPAEIDCLGKKKKKQNLGAFVTNDLQYVFSKLSTSTSVK